MCGGVVILRIPPPPLPEWALERTLGGVQDPVTRFYYIQGPRGGTSLRRKWLEENDPIWLGRS